MDASKGVSSVGRVIFHSDMNNFFASCECLLNPELKDKPVAVCGDEENRRGIVLAKNEAAKKYGIKTCDLVWQAKKKCSNLVILSPRHDLYREFSRKAMQLYSSYTDRIEPFGLDEAWLDMSNSTASLEEGKLLADRLRQHIKEEIGLTASVGVAENKVFAKLGSDMRKPDATTVISPQNYKDLIWNMSAENMLFVGDATRSKLNRAGILTIGDIAKTPQESLRKLLGKHGDMLWIYANGDDMSEVRRFDEEEEVKSIGHSVTLGKDISSIEDAKPIICELCDKVAKRLRKKALKANTVVLWVRYMDFESYQKQEKLCDPTQLAFDIVNKTLAILSEPGNFKKPIRALGVRVTDIVGEETKRQQSLFSNEDYSKIAALEESLDGIRERFGTSSIRRASSLSNGKEMEDE